MTTLDIGIKEHEEINYERRLHNFALIILKSPKIDKEELARDISNLTNSAINTLGVVTRSEPTKIDPENLPNSKYVIYQSYIRTSKEHYLELLNENPENLKETLEFFEDEKYDEEKILNSLEEEALMNTGRYPDSEYVEVAYPAKFKNMLDEQGYEVIDIKLYGTLNENELIDDEIILQEFQGLTGIEKVLFKGSATSSSKPELAETLEKAIICTNNNPIWKGHISHFFNLINLENREFEVSVTVFNPFNILISLFRCFKYQTNGFIPYYELKFKFEDESEVQKMYHGIITWNGIEVPTLKEIINEHFEGDEFSLVSPMMWGGDIGQNLKVLKHLGLKYSSIFAEHNNDKILNKFLFQDFEFLQIHEDNFKTIYDFVDSNIDFLIELASLIESYSFGPNNEMVSNAKK